MTRGIESRIFYFSKKGAVNTDRTLDIALSFCRDNHIAKVVVASSTRVRSFPFRHQDQGHSLHAELSSGDMKADRTRIYTDGADHSTLFISVDPRSSVSW